MSKVYLLMKEYENLGYFEDFYHGEQIVSVHSTREGALQKMRSNDIFHKYEEDWDGDEEWAEQFYSYDTDPDYPSTWNEPDERHTMVKNKFDTETYHYRYYISEKELEP